MSKQDLIPISTALLENGGKSDLFTGGLATIAGLLPPNPGCLSQEQVAPIRKAVGSVGNHPDDGERHLSAAVQLMTLATKGACGNCANADDCPVK